MMDVFKSLEGTWCLPLLWKHGSKPRGSKFSFENVWSMFGKCAKNKGTRQTWESKPWIWEQKKNQLMNIVMCQKQTKIILVIHSCASQWKFSQGNGNLLPKEMEFREVGKHLFRMRGNVFLGNLAYNRICFLEKCHSRKLSLWGTISPICSLGNSTPDIFKVGPCIMFNQGLLWCEGIHYFPWEGNQPLLSPRKPFSWKLPY